MEEKKLVLVLDLDLTLLSTASFKNVGEEEAAFLEKFYALERTMTLGFKNRPLLHKLEVGLPLWTKFRPFAFEFVEEASRLFDVHIYTSGCRMYAEMIVSLLDPTGKLIKRDHIISRNESPVGKGKDLAVVPGADESRSLIVDDSRKVWPKKQHWNLIQVFQYHYFRWNCHQCGFPESYSYSSLNTDENGQRMVLANVLQGLKRIRSEYFHRNHSGGGQLDVRKIMAEFRMQMLSGCKFVICTKEYIRIQQACRALGAECTSNLDDSVTHIVAIDSSAEEVEWGTQHEKFVIRPEWFLAANMYMCRPREADFPCQRVAVA